MRSRNSTVLITGGLGYIGGYVMEDLICRGWKVRVLDNRYRAAARSIRLVESRQDVELVEGDIRYPAMVEQAMRGVEAVVHLAAVCINKSVAAPAESLDVNLLGTQHVLDAAAAHGVRRVVFASSASVYGNSPNLPMSEHDSLDPLTPYCVAKLAGEQLLTFQAQRSSLEWNALRLFNVYGPGQPTDAYYTSVIVTFLNRLMQGLPPEIDGAGDQTMDFVHVTDVARAFGMALDASVTDHVLNVGTGHQTSIADLASMLVEACGKSLEPVFRPREVLVNRRQASITAITEVLGWSPRVSLQEGLAELVAWVNETAEPRGV
jgi:UDP-glucose 4-epimerase